MSRKKKKKQYNTSKGRTKPFLSEEEFDSLIPAHTWYARELALEGISQSFIEVYNPHVCNLVRCIRQLQNKLSSKLSSEDLQLVRSTIFDILAPEVKAALFERDAVANCVFRKHGRPLRGVYERVNYHLRSIAFAASKRESATECEDGLFWVRQAEERLNCIREGLVCARAIAEAVGREDLRSEVNTLYEGLRWWIGVKEDTESEQANA